MNQSTLSVVFLVVALAVLWFLGLFDLTLGSLALLGVALVAGAFFGIGLGRRSTTANAYYDRARAKWDETEAELRAEIQRLKDKARN